MNDTALIKRCQEGDEDAFKLLVEYYSASAVRTAYLLTGRKDMAEDIAQEAFIQCYREIRRLKKPETFQAWFYRILTRLGWRFMAKEKGKLSLEALTDGDKLSLSNEADLAETVEAHQRKDMLQKALVKLNAPLRTTLVLHYFNELSIKEIAAVLGCREGTVKSRLCNARRQLARELQKIGFDLSSLDEERNPGEKNTAQPGKECEASAV